MKGKVIPAHCKEIKKKLIDVNMTQKELANIVGVHVNYLTDVLNGRKPGYKYLERIFDVLSNEEIKEKNKNVG